MNKQKLLLLHEQNPIHLTFTEEDRRQADSYLSNSNCLVATALKRKGYKNPQVGGHFATIDKQEFSFRSSLILNAANRRIRPYYDESIVGQSIVLQPYPPVATLQ